MEKEILSHAQDLILLVSQQVEDLASKRPQEELHIALPGGRSASYLISGLARLPSDLVQRINLYLVDERLEGEKNLDALLGYGLDELTARGLSFHMISLGEKLSSVPFDMVFLGVGEDGHIASLFPNSFPGLTSEQTTLVEDSPKPPIRRVTLSWNSLQSLCERAHIFLLFLGEGKRDALHRFENQTENPTTLPCAFFASPLYTTTIVTDLNKE